MALYNDGNKIIGSNITDVEEAKMNEMIANKIVNNIDSSSTNDTIPSAKAVHSSIVNGPRVTTVDQYGSDILYFPCGVYTIVSNVIAGTLANLPQSSAGILTVTSINPNVTLDMVYSYRCYRYETYLGDVFYRTVQSSVSTPVTIDYDTGWQRVCTTKVADVAPYVTTSFETSTLTRGVQIEVKNGVCTISGWPFGSTTTGLGISILKNMPMPTGTRTAPIVVDNTGEVIGMVYVDVNTTDLKAHFYKTGEGYFTLSYQVKES